MTVKPKVIVVGGGLAGMACAVALETSGAIDVTLLEARRSLGGRAGSFDDPQTGEQLDNCQHVLLGCCTNLIDFYRRIGAIDRIAWHRAIHFRDERGRRHDLYGIERAPAPFHLAPSLLTFNLLTIPERVALARAMIAMMRIGRAGRTALERVAFGDWLDDQHQPATLVRKLYDPIVVSGLNEDTRRASASYAIQIFQDSLLAHSAGYVFGLPACTLAELYSSLPCRDVRLGARVGEIMFGADGRVEAVELQSGEMLRADAFVLATNHHAVQKWIERDRAARDARFEKPDQLESVPILGAHLWFDRPVMLDSHAALIDGPLQWLFRKDASGRSVHGVISAARDCVDRSKDEMLREFEQQVRTTLPAARDAKLIRGVVVIEKRATFSPLPGTDAHRPGQAPPPGGIENLYLAGDYTRTGWPATMEGAVRSGYLSADAVLSRLAPEVGHRSFLVDDLPLQWPARLMQSSSTTPPRD